MHLRIPKRAASPPRVVRAVDSRAPIHPLSRQELRRLVAEMLD